MSTRVFSTKEVSILFSISKKTIRHYYKKGLIKPSFIDGNGYWYFNKDDLDIIELIQKLKSFKFQLNEIKLILNSKDIDIELLIEDRRKQVESEIEELKYAKESLYCLEERKFNLKNVDKVIDNTHESWIKKHYSREDYYFLMKMMVGPTAYEDHKKVFSLFRKINFSLEGSYIDTFENNIDELLDIIGKYYSNFDEIMKAIYLQLDIMKNGPDFMCVINDESERKLKKYLEKRFMESSEEESINNYEGDII